MVNKDNVLEIVKKYMNMKMADNKKNKNIHKLKPINRKVTTINLTKTRNKIHFLHLKLKRRQLGTKRNLNYNYKEVS